MNQKFWLFLLLLTSLIGYTEWGTTQHAHLFQIEAELLRKLFNSPKDLIHPFVILPFLGQLILLIAILKKQTPRWLIIIGILFLGILLLLLLLIGILARDAKIIGFALPYVLLSILYFVRSRRKTHI